MKWLQKDMRTDWPTYAAVGLILLGVLIAATSGCSYEPLDENGECYRPWNDDPYAMTDADWFDRNLYTASEAERKTTWIDENPPTDWVDAVRR